MNTYLHISLPVVYTKSVSVKTAEKLRLTQKEDKECFYCHKTGHVIANCLALKQKEQNSSPAKPKGVGVTRSKSPVLEKVELDCTPDLNPFCWMG